MGLSSRVTPLGALSCGGVDGTRLPPTNLVPTRLPLSRLSLPSVLSTPLPCGEPFVTSGTMMPSGPGTSSEVCLTRLSIPPRLVRCLSAEVGLVWIGNRVSGPPLLLSRRWPRGPGAGLVARLREALAFSNKALLRSSTKAFLLLSSVLMARGRLLEPTDDEWFNVDIRFNSLKMGSLCANRSRTKRVECFSSSVSDVSVRGLSTHGASVDANEDTYSSSAEVSSMSRVK